MAHNDNYPQCTGCGHPLCFMDRRDWAECPECGHDIPDWLRVDSEWRPTHPGVPAGMIPMRSGLVPLDPATIGTYRVLDADGEEFDPDNAQEAGAKAADAC